MSSAGIVPDGDHDNARSPRRTRSGALRGKRYLACRRQRTKMGSPDHPAQEARRPLNHPSHNPAWAIGPLLAGLLIAASTATADTTVVGLSPKVARPGERVDLRIACGACPADATFPISLVPVAKAPRPYPCGDNALCIPTAPAPPRQPRFLFLGSTSGARARPGGAATWFGFASSLYRPDDRARRLRLRHLRREQAGPAREPDSRHGSWPPSSDSAERDSGGLRRGRFRRDLVDRGRHRDDRASACGRSAAPSAASIMRLTGTALDQKADCFEAVRWASSRF
jgi:hypothetical protein